MRDFRGFHPDFGFLKWKNGPMAFFLTGNPAGRDGRGSPCVTDTFARDRQRIQLQSGSTFGCLQAAGGRLEVVRCPKSCEFPTF